MQLKLFIDQEKPSHVITSIALKKPTSGRIAHYRGTQRNPDNGEIFYLSGQWTQSLEFRPGAPSVEVLIDPQGSAGEIALAARVALRAFPRIATRRTIHIRAND